ncbi:MAG: dipeptidase [Thermovirgaceae bacterium]
MNGEEAERILEESVVVDAHFDLAMDLQDKRERGQKDTLGREHIPGFRRGRMNLVVSSIFLHDWYLPEMALRKALTQISILKQEIRRLRGEVMLVTDRESLEEALKKNIPGILMSFEGAEPLGNDLDLLSVFRDLGVRGIGLAWSRRNYVADGCFFSKKKEGKKGGLTDFGVRVLEEASRLGMFVDVSHLNDEGFWDVMEFYDEPLIASHSNCRALVDSPRNLTDEQIQAVAEKGGVIGMNAYAAFVAEDYRARRAGVEDLLDHLDHVVELVGVSHAGIGFDFCSGFEGFSSFGSGEKAYEVLGGHKDMALWVKGLLGRGYDTREIGRILGGNFLDFFRQVL